MALHPQLIKNAEFKIRTYEIDHRKQATVPALVKIMHEAAMENVIDLQLSVWDLEPHHISWVLMRKHLVINHLPKLGETVEVVTHCAGFEKFFTYRDYKVYNQSKELLAYASSTWLLMDTKNRRMTRIPDFISAIECPPESACLPRPSRQTFSLEKVDLQKQYTVRWYELDFNHHLNNVFYLQWMLETAPDDFLLNRAIKKIDIVYKQECQWKEQVTSEIQVLDNHHLIHRLVRKVDGKTLSLAKTTWE